MQAIKLLNPIDGITTSPNTNNPSFTKEGDERSKPSFLDLFNRTPVQDKESDGRSSEHSDNANTETELPVNVFATPVHQLESVKKNLIEKSNPVMNSKQIRQELNVHKQPEATTPTDNADKECDAPKRKTNTNDSPSLASDKESGINPLKKEGNTPKTINTNEANVLSSDAPTESSKNDFGSKTLGNDLNESRSVSGSQKVIESSYKGISGQLAQQLETFSSSSLNSQQLTIKIRPSNLGEIVIILEKTEPTSASLDKTTMAPIDIKMIASNPEVANYLSVIKRDISTKTGLRTNSIGNISAMSKSENDKKNSDSVNSNILNRGKSKVDELIDSLI